MTAGWLSDYMFTDQTRSKWPLFENKWQATIRK